MSGQRRMLQAFVLLASVVPLGAGAAGVLAGGAFLADQAASAAQDSHYRYLSGLLLALGLAFVSTAPNIERRGARFRLLTLIVVVGGVARLTGVLLTGSHGPSTLFALAMELVVTPALALWQGVVARAARGGSKPTHAG